MKILKLFLAFVFSFSFALAENKKENKKIDNNSPTSRDPAASSVAQNIATVYYGTLQKVVDPDNGTICYVLSGTDNAKSLQCFPKK
jgi:hypothetical protein